MPGKDLEQIRALGDKYRLDEDERSEFVDFIENCKRSGDRGSRNKKGDFTWGELIEKLEEFLGADEAERRLS